MDTEYKLVRELDMALCGIHFVYDTQRERFTEVNAPSNQQSLYKLDYDGEFFRGYLCMSDKSLVNEKTAPYYGNKQLRAIAFPPELIDPNSNNYQIMRDNEFSRNQRLGVVRFDENTTARIAGEAIKVDYPAPGYQLNVGKSCLEIDGDVKSRIFIPSNGKADDHGRMCYVHNPGDKFLTPFNSHPMIVEPGANVVIMESLVKMDPIGYADAMKLPRTELLSIYPVIPNWKIEHYPAAEHELRQGSSRILSYNQNQKPAYNNNSKFPTTSNRQSVKPKRNKGQKM